MGAVLVLAAHIWTPAEKYPYWCSSVGWGSNIPFHRQQEALTYLQAREILNFKSRPYFLFKIQIDRDCYWPQQHYVTLSTTQMFSWGFLLERQACSCRALNTPTLGRGAWRGGVRCAAWLPQRKKGRNIEWKTRVPQSQQRHAQPSSVNHLSVVSNINCSVLLNRGPAEEVLRQMSV